MNTTEAIPDEVKAQLQQTLDDLVKGIRRPEKMKAACQRMDTMRSKSQALRRTEHRRRTYPRKSRSCLGAIVRPSGRFNGCSP